MVEKIQAAHFFPRRVSFMDPSIFHIAVWATYFCIQTYCNFDINPVYMKINIIGCLTLFLLCYLKGNTQVQNNEIIKDNLPSHPMQYYIALPKGWSASRKWPVLITVSDASKKFMDSVARFRADEGEYPFIIVSPISVANGNFGYRSSSLYPYSAETWDKIDKEGNCSFDINGLEEVIKDVKMKYNGEDKVYITALESGAHLLWAIVFLHPGWLNAAAPVCGNYIGRCIDYNTKAIGLDQLLPIRSFYGEKDKNWKFFIDQDKKARNLALASGFKNVMLTGVPSKGHELLTREILDYFYQLYKQKQDKK